MEGQQQMLKSNQNDMQNINGQHQPKTANQYFGEEVYDPEEHRKQIQSLQSNN